MPAKIGFLVQAAWRFDMAFKDLIICLQIVPPALIPDRQPPAALRIGPIIIGSVLNLDREFMEARWQLACKLMRLLQQILLHSCCHALRNNLAPSYLSNFLWFAQIAICIILQILSSLFQMPLLDCMLVCFYLSFGGGQCRPTTFLLWWIASARNILSTGCTRSWCTTQDSIYFVLLVLASWMLLELSICGMKMHFA